MDHVPDRLMILSQEGQYFSILSCISLAPLIMEETFNLVSVGGRERQSDLMKGILIDFMIA